MKCWYCRAACSGKEHKIINILIGNNCWSAFDCKKKVDSNVLLMKNEKTIYYSWKDHEFEYKFIIQNEFL